jgi:hypothetical protein
MLSLGHILAQRQNVCPFLMVIYLGKLIGLWELRSLLYYINKFPLNDFK